MLVSKIKPCMSKYKLLISETADGSLNQLLFNGTRKSYMDNCGNSRANTCDQASTLGFGVLLLGIRPARGSSAALSW